ncbi:MAG TPA: phenylalanine--tRNA ligase subunit beta [Vicinamibacterales bacterium]|nr:phenylalanine--tRNA ligase subunit beta [Vicinamibacterales bacterium]
MKVLFSWLKEFVDVPGTAADVAARLSVRGFAVEGIEGAGDDAVIDFEVTANRPDCLSVLGLAREVATAYTLPLREPAENVALASLIPADRAEVSVHLDDPDLGPRYAGAAADVTVGASPEWLQARLRSAGVRPISNVVDITNYVLLELGQPMHAFDLTKIGGAEIRVRRARPGERIATLDGQNRALAPEMLVIADAAAPIAIAGVMGGADSEVSGGTRTIVFESASFNANSVRRTSKALGLKTEASTRFERGVDPNLPLLAMRRACALLEAAGAGRARGQVVDAYPAPVAPRQLALRRSRLASLLGVNVPDADVTAILSALGFGLAPAGDGWMVTAPTRRVDVVREVDVIEEVARHYGFDRIPATFPALRAAAPPMDPRITRARHLRRVLTGAGFSEAVTFGFIAEPAAAPFAAPGDVAAIANPLSETFAVLRPSALPGLLDALAHNRRREQRDVRLFELGNVFSKARGERQSLALAWIGGSDAAHWSGAVPDVTFFDMKGAVDRVCRALHVQAAVVPHAESWLVAGQAAALMSGEQRIGVVGRLSKALAERHGLPGDDAVFVADLDLDAVASVAGAHATRVVPLPRYPSVTRDIALLVSDTLPAADLRASIRRAAPPTLAEVREFDRYQGKGVPDGKVSLALRLTFRAADRTLTDAEIQTAMDAIMRALSAEHAAVQR